MKIIDAHMHLSHITSFQETAQSRSFVNYSVEGLLREYAANNVVLGIGMGLTETVSHGFPDQLSHTPMGLDMITEQFPKQIVYCPGINPFRLNNAGLDELERCVQQPEAVGIKIYLGYYPYYAYDPIYQPVYELAKQYQVPVVFHTGDTYSERGLLKYSHPLTIDEVAVTHRGVNFMMAHLGDPWVLDGIEVVYKNRNVFADVSGLIVGNAAECIRMGRDPLTFAHLRQALAYGDHYEKILFGTDWPLAPVAPYLEFIQHVIPATYHHDVFFNTALQLFPKIRPLVT
ncbi:amidohydrolase family protein [Paenibacillus yanchengensis]|uniref:Amidohydrolase family protein n=1 Tax=Paenibacillus yanchengensis TaxID=2035833 RepID=A0ABW4YQK6_9BACL